MPRDYADSTNRKKPGQLPGWVWMLGGLVIGLFIAFLVYLDKSTPASQKNGLGKIIDQTVKEIRNEENKPETKPAADKSKSSDKSTTAASDKDKPAPKFDFYYILPELEVAVPDQELNKKRGDDKPLDPNSSYILQAASFKSADDADRLKAKLALSGVTANIQSVTVNNDIWYRVRVGPIKDVATLDKTRKRLQENGINAIVIKAK